MRKSLFLVFGLVLCLSAAAVAADAEYEAIIDFSNGHESGWGPMGGAVRYIAAEEFRSEPFSLAVLGRTQIWEGTIFQVSNILEEGGVYTFSLWIKAMEAKPGSTAWITAVRVDKAGNASYERLCDPVEVNTTDWVEVVIKDFVFSLDGLDRIEFYPEIDDVEASYYMDDFKIVGNKPIKL
ncbi:MAG: hypothetical protein GX228_06515 [Firmicutes bacterium]|nr:carbohydrate binding domain-containing protein [Bacillota bacterium]NLL88568.1 hypothetical protein [Bacillota bacterium]HKM18014.1 carbohydrate binding domain-containing protein [Limnochordia bacterium]